MTNIKFPMNYFMSIFTPKAMFKGRKNLNWFGILFIFIFLNALLLIPIPLFYAHANQVNIHPFMPRVEQMIGNKKLQKVVNRSDYSQQTRKFQFKKSQVLSDKKNQIIGINLSKDQLASRSAAVNIKNDTFTFKEDKLSFVSKYQSSYDPKKSMENFLQNSWYLENRGYIATMMLMMLAMIIVIINLFVILGTSFLLYLSHRSSISDIKTFKESVNLTLNAIGLGMILAMLCSLISFNVMILIFMPTLFMVLMIAFIYMRTRFLDVR